MYRASGSQLYTILRNPIRLQYLCPHLHQIRVSPDRLSASNRLPDSASLRAKASGLVPLYSTSWSNFASLAVARKLGLVTYARKWGIL